MTLQEKREKIAKLGGYELITNHEPHVWKNKYNTRILSISFDKPKMFGYLMLIVGLLEQRDDLIIEIKRKQCTIKKMHLTHNWTIVDIDGDSKQQAVFEALTLL